VAQVNHHNLEIQPRSVEKWDRGRLIIPSVCSTSNGTCRIIEVSYTVVFTFGASSSFDENLTIPVTIGTMPLRDISEFSLAPSAPMEMPSPPSYEACMLFINFEIFSK
jgi:hypothetical protein